LSRRERSGDPLPAQLAGLPPGDSPVPADDLDFPQPAPVTVHRLLSLDYAARSGGLGNLALEAGLLDENELRRPGRGPLRVCTAGVTRIDHTPYDIPAAPGSCHSRYNTHTTTDPPA